MAKYYVCYSFCQNPLLIGKDQFDRDALKVVSIDCNKFATFIYTMSYTRSLGIISALVFTLFSNNNLFKQFIKVYLKTQILAQIKLK